MSLLHTSNVATSRIRPLTRALTAGLFVIAVALVACGSPPPRPVTPTPTAAPIVFATAPPTFTPLGGPPATPTRPSTPTRTLVVQATRSLATPTPLVSPVTGSSTLYVTNTDGLGVAIRDAPGGAPVRVVGEGTALTATGEEQISEGRLWKEVKDTAGNVGWVAADFLVESSHPLDLPTSTPFPLPPTVLIELIPTATHGVPQRAPTRTPLPSPTPRGIIPVTAGPLIPPTPAPTSVSVDRSPVPR